MRISDVYISVAQYVIDNAVYLPYVYDTTEINGLSSAVQNARHS